LILREAGGFVDKSRVSGQLAVTRALGDLALKKAVNQIEKFNFSGCNQYSFI